MASTDADSAALADKLSSARVSVALCTYNGATFVAQQLRSIVAQGAAIDEIVIADDGSTDGTLDIVRAVAEEPQSRENGVAFRILDNVGNSGVTKNFERAIAACRSEFIVLSDQDDLWAPKRLEKQLTELVSRPELSLLHGDARLVDENGRPLGATLFETLEVDAEVRATVHAGGAFGVLLRRNIVTGSTVIFRRSLNQAALPIPREWVHDEWLAIIAAATSTVDLLEVEVTDYRQHGANEIGVRQPTLRNKIDRVLQPRGSRNRELAERSALLEQRVSELADAVAGDKRAAVRAKAQFEQIRANLPAQRWRRIVPVLRLAMTGGYPKYASQGRADVMRDLFQPA